MTESTEARAEGLSNVAAELEHLRQEHARLKARLAELESHISLTAEEQVERVRLKKLKLQAKDRIAALEAAARRSGQ